MVWCDMRATGVDVLVSAPQKGWTGPACCGLVMMNDRAVAQMQAKRPDMLYAKVPGRAHVSFLDEPEALAVINQWLDACK